MKKKKSKRELIKKLHNRYRLMIYDDNSFQVVWNFRITQAKAIRWVVFTIIPLIAITVVLIFFTPLRQFVPGYPEPGMHQSLVRNAALVDSLHHELELQKRYLSSIQSVISGEIESEERPLIDTLERQNITLEPYGLNHDSIFELHLQNTPKIDEPEKEPQTASPKNIYELNFFRPVKGVVTDKFNSKPSHHGVDIVSAPEASIFSTLDGTVIYAGYSVETGYVLYLQHDHNLVSVYKHNLSLLRDTGDRVKAGEAIAIMGNTGELTTGPHLHFELWHKGKALDPEAFVDFD